MIPERAKRPLRVVWDASLAYGNQTGDSTYWTMLLESIQTLADAPVEGVAISPFPAPAEWRDTDAVRWMTVPTRSRTWWSLVQFPMAAQRLRADVVHLQYNASPLLRQPFVTTIHDISFVIGPEWFRPRDRWLLQTRIPRTIARARRVITVSETSRGEIESTYPAAVGKTEVTPNACPRWIQPVPPQAARARATELLGTDAPYALTVGTRWPRKNMALAIDAVEWLPPEVPLRLAVTGKAGWGDQSVPSRGIATGYVSNEDLSALYSAADVYLAPSRHEGFGIPVLEAMRCGCPVLASRGGALPEVVGDAGLVVDSWEASAWTQQLRRLRESPGMMAEMRARGRERERQYDWVTTARRTLAVYHAIDREAR
ncbi:MAG: glycosyltransferase family 1 protein [Fimbriimonadaceae bacterium]|nr:glycosyltransferase family 1 protein [Fimbriimonadaceae bacterium]